MAQNVYSVNIVGYVNVAIPANTQTALANPLDDGTNTLADLGVGWSNNTAVQTWNGSGFNLATKVAGTWSANPLLAPGTGFFFKHPTKAQTLTFVGSAPTSNNYVLASKVNVFVGSVIPFSGPLTDQGPNTLNINSFSNNTGVQTWNGAGFNLATKVAGTWSAIPTIGVAQGLFIKPGSAVANTWTQVLQ
jgi:hypothetical protein